MVVWLFRVFACYFLRVCLVGGVIDWLFVCLLVSSFALVLGCSCLSSLCLLFCLVNFRLHAWFVA